MAFQEKRAWITAVVTAASFAAYLKIILGRADGLGLASVPYVATMLWAIGAAILATIFLTILAALTSPGEAGEADERDREIDRFGEQAGQVLVAVGGAATLALSMAELSHFWISNVLYATFALSSILAAAAKIVAYHRGLLWR